MSRRSQFRHQLIRNGSAGAIYRSESEESEGAEATVGTGQVAMLHLSARERYKRHCSRCVGFH